MNEKYLFIKAYHKETKDKCRKYGIAYILLMNENSCDLLQAVVQDSQVDILNKNAINSSFKIEDYITLAYNPYKKEFELKIKYGLKM